MADTGIKVVLGAASIRSTRHFTNPDLVRSLLDVAHAAGVTTIDTAEVYEDSEVLLGQANAGARFTFDTKAPGGFRPGTLSTASLLASIDYSLKKLGVDKVDIYYIHAPDLTAPVASWLPGIDEIYKAGKFARFGLSNFKAEDVRDVYNYAAEHGYVLPTVYQGNYSAVARLQETVLFPTLRELGIAFYAYSPMAGGFLTKKEEDFLNGGIGRFDTSTSVGRMYTAMYSKPAYLEALTAWETLTSRAGLEKGEVAYRWVAWNSALKAKYGDAIIVGPNSLAQTAQSLEWLKKGPLDEATVLAIEGVWETIKDEAPLDNYHK